MMKKPCGTHRQSASKHSLGDMSPPQPLGQTSNGSMTSHIHVQDPLTCQQQAYISMSAQQPTCDRKLKISFFSTVAITSYSVF